MSKASSHNGLGVMRFFFCGVGGLGTLMTAQIVAEASRRAGLDVVASEVHGMSQRGGSVQTSVLIGGARSPLIAEGGADIFVGLEPLEALRYRSKIGPWTTVIVNKSPVVPVTVTMGGPPYPDIESIEETMRALGEEYVGLDATALATQEGTSRAANVVMLGAMCAMRQMPFDEVSFFQALDRAVPSRFIEVNRRAFEAGKRAATAALTTTAAHLEVLS